LCVEHGVKAEEEEEMGDVGAPAPLALREVAERGMVEAAVEEDGPGGTASALGRRANGRVAREGLRNRLEFRIRKHEGEHATGNPPESFNTADDPLTAAARLGGDYHFRGTPEKGYK
jgi:hypothetical protein